MGVENVTSNHISHIMTKETVLITGASSGIGMEFAKLFAQDGSNLVLVARRKNKLHQLSEELKTKYGIKAYVLPKDLSKKSASIEIFDHLREKSIEIDIVVNNAGFGTKGAIVDLDIEHQLDMIQVNVMALTNLTRLFLPRMVKRGSGGVLNVGSVAGFQPGPHLAVYCATKAYVLLFTEALAEEIRNSNIKISCFAPGPVKTEFGEKSYLRNSLLFKIMRPLNVEPTVKVAYKGFRKGEVIITPGFKAKIMAFLNRLTPRFIVRKIAKILNTR